MRRCPLTVTMWPTFALLLLLLFPAGCQQDETGTRVATGKAASQQLPRLVDVGADKCIPCIKMAPILDQLREDFAGQLEVVFVDAWKDRETAAEYRVQMIPTQIFYAPDGRELYRHVGFYGREDILGKWRELGFDFGDRPR